MPVYEYPTCPTCGCGADCTCQPCFLCKDTFRRAEDYACVWTYVGAGFEDGDAACSVFNGTFRLFPSGNCSWTYSDATRTLIWRFNPDETRWELTLDAEGVTLLYGISGPDWTCCGVNTPVFLSGAGCAAQPETVTLTPETPCPCPPDPCACFPCPLCDDRGQQFPCTWRFLGDGFADGTVVCSRFNRTLNLRMTGSCTWEYDDPTDVRIILVLSTGTVTLTLFSYTPPGTEVLVARYTLNVAEWACCGGNTLPLSQNGNVCGAVPSTVTLSPITPCACGTQDCILCTMPAVMDLYNWQSLCCSGITGALYATDEVSLPLRTTLTLVPGTRTWRSGLVTPDLYFEVDYPASSLDFCVNGGGQNQYCLAYIKYIYRGQINSDLSVVACPVSTVQDPGEPSD